jgi:predicted aspartyl protease
MRIDIFVFALFQAYVTIDNVSINGVGQYRFLVDTGSQSTMIDESVARSLSLTPTYRVALATPTGSRLVPAAMADTIAAGAFGTDKIEVLWSDLRASKSVDREIQGILGNNFLSRFDYIIDFKTHTLRLGLHSTLSESVKGEKIPFRLDEGRIVIPVRLRPGGQPHDFILDSGASSLVLPMDLADTFEIAGGARLRTHSGEERVGLTTVPCIFIGSSVFRNVPAAVQRVALMPAQLFESIYVNSEENYLIVNPRM